ncbi:sugar transferase [Pseudonocardia spirodelae]|uniref:Sugar transferase n=1 Tax=Pseudonocardia spirodelae TaxID=3133431 RepID=A0ABU8T2R7_9PSEU
MQQSGTVCDTDRPARTRPRQDPGPDGTETAPGGGPPVEVRPLLGIRSARRLQAWMIVLPVDALMLAAPALWTPKHWKGFLALSLVALLFLTEGGRYRARLHISVLDELPRLLTRVLAAGAVIATVFAVRHDDLEVTSILAGLLAGMGLFVLGRVLTNRIILVGRRRRIVAHRTLIVGNGALARELCTLLRRYPQYGLLPVGFVDGDPDRDEVWHADQLDEAVRRTGSDVIVIADGELTESQVLDVLRHPSCAQCDVMVVPRLHQFWQQSGTGDHIGSVPVMRVRSARMDGPRWFIKRSFDIAVSSVTLVLLSPLLLVCAVAVSRETRAAVLFRQERIGRGGRPFVCLKFQTMKPATSTEGATRWSIAHDTRVGRVGRLLRRTGLDELPQLWNILRGDMTLVGPRPERPFFVDRFSQQWPHYSHRHRVPAGLTGLAQVSGLRGDVPISDRARFDNYYIENWSLWLDVKIVLRTFAEVLLARGR